jgi:putative DNA primase/helicase
MAQFGYTGPFTPTAKVIWKTAGATDMVAILSLDIPDDHTACCNACGESESPISPGAITWVQEFQPVPEVFVLHDCDLPGQAGATWTTKPNGKKRPGWAPAIASFAPCVRNVVLPYPIAESHGKDVRDWIVERLEAGRDRASIYAELLEYARSQPIVQGVPGLGPDDSESGDDDGDDDDGEGVETDGDDDDGDGGDGDGDGEEPEEPEEEPLELPDDPHRLARINLKVYQQKHGGVLKYWRQQWWKYRDGKYREISDSDLEAKVIASIRREFVSLWREDKERYEKWVASKNYDEKKDKGTPFCRPVKDRLTRNVVNVMKSLCLVSSDAPMPCWLPDRTQRHYVSTLNGIVDMDAVFDNEEERACLIPHNPDWFCTLRLNYPFDKEAKCPLWIRYLNISMEGDQQRINVLQEWAGYLLTATNYLQKFLALEGEGGNGKTVFFAAMTAMLGEDNVSNVSIENFGDRFALTSTIGKAANISGDVGETDNIAEGILKQYTGGGNMQFDRKNRDPISAKPTAKLMCAWNTRPRIKDKTNGIWRRMIVVPFNREITKDEKVRGMDDFNWWLKQGEVPGILRWAIAGLDRLREQEDFTQSDTIENAIENYKEEVNPTLRFLKEYVTTLPPERMAEELQKDESLQVAIDANDLFAKYAKWCDEEGVKPLSRNNFGLQIKRRFGDLRQRRRGEWERYYVYRLLCYRGNDE